MPGRFRLLPLLVALGLATACSSSEDPAVAVGTPAPGLPTELACQDFPVDAATSLITDPATGSPRVPGAVSRAVSVASTTPGPENSSVHVIAFDVEGKAFVLVHPVTDGSGEATGQGPFASVTSNTAAATGIPEDEQLEALASGESISLAVGCLTD